MAELSLTSFYAAVKQSPAGGPLGRYSLGGTYSDSDYYMGFYRIGADLMWQGNLKKYQIAQWSDGKTEITGRDGAALIDVNNNFRADIADDWSLFASSNRHSGVLAGGIRDQLSDRTLFHCAPEQRQLYAFLGEYDTAEQRGWASTPVYRSQSMLSGAAQCVGLAQNRLDRLRPWMGDVADNPDIAREALQSLLLQAGVRSTPALSGRQSPANLGAYIHAHPVVVKSGTKPLLPDTAAGSSLESNEKTIIFTSNTQGIVQAIDADDGQVMFEFLPRELLARLPTVSKNPLTFERPDFSYGMDLPWIVWRQDAVKREDDGRYHRDGVIDTASNDEDHVIIYGGMRRGGQNYYALDVTGLVDVSRQFPPRLMFTILGGQQADKDSPYYRMGQTWSQPTLAQVLWQGRVRQVLLFGGGYDAPRYDHGRLPGMAAGSQVFMVDARSGELLWWAAGPGQGADQTVATMVDSVPARVRVLDIDGNGLVDRFYVNDIAGRVFRFDIADERESPHEGVGRVRMVADLSDLGREVRFFNAPSVAPIRLASGQSGIAIALTSGDVANPNQQLNIADNENDGDTNNGRSPDAVFMLLDSVSKAGDSERRPVTLDIRSLTNVSTQSADGLDAPLHELYSGWWMNLDSGMSDRNEKGLSKTVIFNGKLYFSTYVPPSVSHQPQCDVALGSSRLYVMDVLTGAATQAFSNSSMTTGAAGRWMSLGSVGLASRFELISTPEQWVINLNGVLLPIGEGGLVEVETVEQSYIETGAWSRWRW